MDQEGNAVFAGRDHETKAYDRSNSPDERREWLRLNDRVFLEYRLVGEVTLPREAPREDMVSMFVGKPTEDLLARLHQGEGDTVLVPWLMKIDWVLELILQSLLRMRPEGMMIPRLMDVNLSGGGICFTMDQCVKVGVLLDLRLILPPFTPIKARAEVIRVETIDDSAPAYSVGTRFVEISSDDQERLIHHILQLQAERLRTRHVDLL